MNKPLIAMLISGTYHSDSTIVHVLHRYICIVYMYLGIETYFLDTIVFLYILLLLLLLLLLYFILSLRISASCPV